MNEIPIRRVLLTFPPFGNHVEDREDKSLRRTTLNYVPSSFLWQDCSDSRRGGETISANHGEEEFCREYCRRERSTNCGK